MIDKESEDASESPTICLDRRACPVCFSVKNSHAATRKTCKALLNQMALSVRSRVTLREATLFVFPLSFGYCPFWGGGGGG